MVVPRYNYDFQFNGIADELLKEIYVSLTKGKYILTSEVSEFEQDFSNYIGAQYTIGVNSGTDALLLAFTALSIGSGDEVITVANTFHASVLAILKTGARPILVDCDPNSYMMDLDQVRAAITSKTRALLVVHLYGQALDMQPILELAERYGLYVIEDACQAVGASWNGKKVGSIGLLGCFSFHPSKNLSAAGDAGAITTSDPVLNNRLRKLRNFGQEIQNNHEIVGFNTKLDSIQALILMKKLPVLDQWNSLRVQKAEKYRTLLSSLPIAFQLITHPYSHVFHLFGIRLTHRDQLLDCLHKHDIDAVVRYPIPIHLQAAFSSLGYSLGDFPNAEVLAKETVCLPIRPDISQEELHYVSEIVHHFCASM